jgi:ABC-2 type transport system permease protein
MSTKASAMPNTPMESRSVTPAAVPMAQRMFWLIRRELWENRSLYIAPLAVAALIIFGFLVSTVHFARKVHAALALDLSPLASHPMPLQEVIERPFEFAALLLMATTLVLAVFYSLEALYGERRDRSILFWKSLPVSDVETVLSKAAIPIVILPLITFVITLLTQAILLVLSTLALSGDRAGLTALWTHLSPFRMALILFYHLLFLHGLWYAPFFGWFLLVSAWARRAPVLWAVLPPLAIGIVEKIAFNTSYFGQLLHYRFFGISGNSAPSGGGMSLEAMTHPGPLVFLASPGLWFGLAFTALCLAIAIRIRRYREPI